MKAHLARSQADDIMNRLIQDNEFRAVLERKLKEVRVGTR